MGDNEWVQTGTVEDGITLNRSDIAPEILYRNGNFDDAAVERYEGRLTKDRDGYIPGTPIKEIQQDLITIGLSEDVTIADGEFGPGTERAVRKFQEEARKNQRLVYGQPSSVASTYSGPVNGSIDQTMLDELDLWISNGYAILTEAPSEEAPSEEAPSEEAPSEEAPPEEAPPEEAPPEEAPPEEAPPVVVPPTTGETSQEDAASEEDSENPPPDEIKNGNYDDVGVARYSGRLKKDGNGYIAGSYVEQLQKDLSTVGVKRMGTPDGDFGGGTERGVKAFQEAALTTDRIVNEQETQVTVTFTGSATGVADRATLDELQLWLSNGYTISDPYAKFGYQFPLAERPSLDYNTGRRFFGAERKGGRKHGGCDLIAPEDTPVYAIADGTVLRIAEKFVDGNRESDGSYYRVDALEIDHTTHTVRYGEIKPSSITKSPGDTVHKGELLAAVGIMETDHMLHFEMYSNEASGSLSNGVMPFKRRSDVVDPAPYLDAMTMRSEGGDTA